MPLGLGSGLRVLFGYDSEWTGRLDRDGISVECRNVTVRTD